MIDEMLDSNDAVGTVASSCLCTQSHDWMPSVRTQVCVCMYVLTRFLSTFKTSATVITFESMLCDVNDDVSLRLCQ